MEGELGYPTFHWKGSAILSNINQRDASQGVESPLQFIARYWKANFLML